MNCSDCVGDPLNLCDCEQVNCDIVAYLMNCYEGVGDLMNSCDGVGDLMNCCDGVGDLMNCCDGVANPVNRSDGDPGNRSLVKI